MTTATKNAASATKVVTGKCRASYVHVFEPYSSDPDQAPRYSVTLLIPKSDTATLAKIKAAQKAAYDKGQAKLGGIKFDKVKMTLHDGDDDDLEQNPEYEGHWRIAVSSKTRPGVVDRDLNPILDSTQVYSGCYVRASINFYAYSGVGGKGISAGLNHLQFLEDGDFLGGRSRAEDDFDAIDADDSGLL